MYLHQQPTPWAFFFLTDAYSRREVNALLYSEKSILLYVRGVYK